MDGVEEQWSSLKIVDVGRRVYGVRKIGNDRRNEKLRKVVNGRQKPLASIWVS